MSNNDVLISLGMPVYNSAKYLRHTLDSLLAQDYGNFELLISDNASTDSTRDICLEYAARDKRVRYYRNERNMGMVWNENRLLELARGEYFKWAGSYDFLEPTYLSACKRVLESDPTVVLAYSLARLINEHDETVMIVPEIIDTRRLPTVARVHAVIAKAKYCAIPFFGLYRAEALRRCRPVLSVLGNHHVMMLEISVLGAIAVVGEVLFNRRESVTPVSEEQRILTALLRMDPDRKKVRNLRPYWEMGVEHLAGAWRLARARKKIFLTPLVAYMYYSRWKQQLKHELRHPYSLEALKAPEF